MANQAYNGQPVNISFDYEGEGTLDSKLVQLSESAAKDPTTWLKNGIYRIGTGQPVFTQDGKIILYIGRKGNATDIADDTKWIKFTSTADVQAAIQTVIASGGGGASNAFHIVDYNISAKPTTDVEAGNAYVVGTAFSLTSSDVLNGVAVDLEAGDMLVAVDVEVETEEDGETVTSNVVKFAVLQANTSVPSLAQNFLMAARANEFANPPITSPGLIPWVLNSGGMNIVQSTGIGLYDFKGLMEDFMGTASSPWVFSRGTGANLSYAAKNGLLGLLFRWANDKQDLGDFDENRTTTAHHFLDDWEKWLLLSMISMGIATADEDTFIAAVVARKSTHYGYGAPLEFVMAVSQGAANNFFGFVKSLPIIRARWEKKSGSDTKGVIHFKNYDLEGTLSTPCVEYTYDLDTKVLSYQKFIEVTVS